MKKTTSTTNFPQKTKSPEEIKFTQKQKKAFNRLLSYIRGIGKSYFPDNVKGKKIKWFTIKEIPDFPYYEIAYGE